MTPTAPRVAPVAIVVGGLSMVALYVPFTVTHGPTSYNEQRQILGLDMHDWGLLLSVLPNVLIASGLWWLRQRIAGDRRGATVVIAVGSVALLLDAFMSLAFLALGPPFVLFVLVPAIVALAILIPADNAVRTRVRLVLTALGIVLAVGIVLTMIPLETSDSFGGYRIYGIAVHGVGGLLWALLGLTLRARQRA